MTDSTTDELPDDVKKILTDHLRSVGHLETILFLFAQRPKDFSAAELIRELRTNEAYVGSQLRDLSEFVAETESRFAYRLNAPSDATLQKLAELYRERKHAIINFIYTKPTDPARSFADAFRLKK